MTKDELIELLKPLPNRTVVWVGESRVFRELIKDVFVHSQEDYLCLTSGNTTGISTSLIELAEARNRLRVAKADFDGAFRLFVSGDLGRPDYETLKRELDSAISYAMEVFGKCK